MRLKRRLVVWERFPIGTESEDNLAGRLVLRSTPHSRHSPRASVCQDLNHDGFERSMPKCPLGVRHPLEKVTITLLKRLIQAKSSPSPNGNGFLMKKC
ncbi:hypothetical protein EYF80_009640 [Liparis tanakae]|uniref:Uncharacterized protein n=1 Tax=Liparis tanakae TaxID=230148 RepID=A0A4Z2IQ89_9TELE|nr:hypothetical protein EYF80_009640 [Liparis tanakae]